MKAVTDATVDALGVQPDSVRVAIYEVSPDDWAAAGTPMSVIRAQK